MINEDELMNPLTPQQIEALKNTQKDLVMLRKAVARARQAGLNVSAQEAEIDELERQAKGMVDVYGRPAPLSTQRRTV